MNTSSFDRLQLEGEALRNRILDALVTPSEHGLPMRQMLEAHLGKLVSQHNQVVTDKLHFLETREARSPEVQAWAPFVANPAPAFAVRNIASQHVDVEEMAQALVGSLSIRGNGVSVLAALSDAQLLELYGRVLLRIQAFALPADSDIA